uniref:Uncharacterized protein n=1 Tax=Grammatophora oceanica TaxID=210454 RepID=A0A7S1UWN1_9STRA|mmetsp:Transcript_27004/g.39487  ORF Transcript_27004/g.39487 Transcript_27004/m.39487 type:complete len:303 (+) Transcript_27004:45-953(+)
MSTMANATNSTNQNHRSCQRNMTRWKRMGSHRNLIREAGSSDEADASSASGRRARSASPTAPEMFEKRKESLLSKQLQDLMRLNDADDEGDASSARITHAQVATTDTREAPVVGGNAAFHHRRLPYPTAPSRGSDASSLSDTCSSAPSSRKESEAGYFRSGIEFEEAVSTLGEEDLIASSERVASARGSRTETTDIVPLFSRSSSYRSGKDSSNRSLRSSLRSGASGSQAQQKKCVRWEDDPILAMTPLEEYQQLRETLRKTRHSVDSKQVALGDLQKEIEHLQERLRLTQEQNQLLESAAT